MTNYTPTISYKSRLFILIICLTCMVSCTVTNNLYVTNPNPMGKGNSEGYLGIGTGVKAKIDSINNTTGKISFTNKISNAPILSVGGQWGVLNQTDVRFALHLPYVLGGVGLRTGLQHSFMDPSAKMNFAIGFDLGGVFAKDSIEIFGSKSPLSRETNGGLNADIFIPFGVNLKKDITIILTPRYSFNRIYIREFQLNNNTSNFNFGYPTLSIGIRKRQFYFETTAIYYDRQVFPLFGIVILFKN